MGNQAKTSDRTETALQLLQKEVGKADKKLLAALLAGTNKQALVKVGTTILSSRIVIDGVRIYPEAWAFWQKASDAQKKTLRGFSHPLLALAVQQLIDLREMEHRVGDDSLQTAATQAARQKAAELIFRRAVGMREQAYTALVEAAGAATGLREAVHESFGTTEDGTRLARGLDSLAGLIRKWHKAEDADLVARLTLGNINAEYADELTGTAKAVRETEQIVQRKGTNAKATQAELDLADGINVQLLGQIIRAFERAHDLDPTIPRLVPISTRRLFNRNTRKKATPEGELAAPAKEEGAKKDGG